ncbi:MAG: ADP-ribosylglycohydrolase family protein [Desulfarculaceae bacterium]
MAGNNKAMVLASFIGDSLALGVHWEYDPRKIEKRHGRVEKLLAPQPGSYHQGKLAGEFTHYGDQMLVLLESVAQAGGFDLNDFARGWQALFADYTGYFDGATKQTLGKFAAGAASDSAGSGSNDLAGASRIAPLAYALAGDEAALLAAVKSQTRMTHNNPAVIAAAEFFARVVLAVQGGSSPEQALEKAAGYDYGQIPLAQWTQKGLASKGEDTVKAISRLGPTCHAPEAFPSVVHLIAKYPEDLRECLIECVMAGGDSAARAMLAGMVLGAGLGEEAIPLDWLQALRKREQILAWLDQI